MRKVSRWQLSGVPMLGLASILEQTVKSLHEANEHPSTDASEQYTILDGLNCFRMTSSEAEVTK